MVRIFSDSTSDLSNELLQRYQVTVIPLSIILGEKSYRDGKEITSDEIYRWAEENKTTPKTAAIAVEDAMAAMKPVLDAGDEIIVFCISEKMSTTGNSLRLAAQSLAAEDRVSVFDTMSLSSGGGLLVIEAAMMAQAGKSREEIVERVTELRPKVSATFVVDTLVYLYRGGRCSGLSAIAGSALHIHPKIIVKDGEMVPDKKYRGKIDTVIMRYAKDLEEELLSARKDRVFITHSGCDEQAIEQVREYLESLHYFDEICITHAGGVVCSHCGPGTLGVLYIRQ